MRVFAFVDRQKAEFAIRTLCRGCRVSTSGYYAWASREAAGPTTAQLAEADLVAKIGLVRRRVPPQLRRAPGDRPAGP